MIEFYHKYFKSNYKSKVNQLIIDINRLLELENIKIEANSKTILNVSFKDSLNDKILTELNELYNTLHRNQKTLSQTLNKFINKTQKNTNTKLKFIDTFAGCGGLSLGLMNVDFNSIENIVGAIGGRKMQIGNTKSEFGTLVTYLNSKVNNVNLEYYNELEEATQTGTEKTTKRIIPRPKDLERANKIFKAIGEEGERLLFQYLESEKRQSNIRDFKWLNQSREMYEPYD
jgi:hypothetical protein